MAVSMPGAESEKKAQHVEGRICFQIEQGEEQFLLWRIEIAFRATRRELLDCFARMPILLYGKECCGEGLGEEIELR